MSSASPETPLATRRILVVDDQPSIRGILELALVEAGADVLTAEDGASALRSVQAAIPDLILLDLAMPGMDGWRVIEALGAIPGATAVPVVLETSAEDYASFDRARRQGVAAFITKPFRLTEILETCCRILGGDRPLQDLGPETAGTPGVEVHAPDGTLLGAGRLLRLAAQAAQLELEVPLALGHLVQVKVAGNDSVAREAEVRWVSRVGGRYHHGLALR